MTAMKDLKDLYQQTIIDHNRSPRNFRVLPQANRAAEGYNPLCGDRVSLQLQVEEGRITDVGFQGSGCAISQASASMMTELVKGKPLDEVRALVDRFAAMLRGDAEAAKDARLGQARALAGVARFPARVRCASIAWDALLKALKS